MEKKYKALRTIGTIYKILGTIVGIITILGVIGICATSVLGGAALESIINQVGSYGNSGASGGAGLFSSALGGLLISFGILINGGGLALTFFALGEGIYVFISIEENTRASVALLNRQANAQ
jgi:hypothetical protein